MRYTGRNLRTRLMLLPLEGRIAPAVFNVTNADDAGAGSLRQAITDANAAAGADTINFSSFFTTPRTISLLTVLPTVTGDVAINGPGKDNLTVRRDAGAAAAFRVFAFNANVDLSGVTVSGGMTAGTGVAARGAGIAISANRIVTLTNAVVTGNIAARDGGGIYVGNLGSLTVRNSTVSGNTAGTNLDIGSGGGIYFRVGGNLLLENSTVSGNTAPAQGGGVYVYGSNTGTMTAVVRNSTIANNTAGTAGTTDATGGGIQFLVSDTTTLNHTLTVQNSTITGNTAQLGGGGISRGGAGMGTITITSSVVAFNSDPTAPDLNGPATASFSLIRDQTGATITDGGNNLAVGTDPGFVGGSTPTLAANGGPTNTIAITSTSALRNAGSNPAGLGTDQRGPGFPREVGQADIGAFEFLPPGTPIASGTFSNLTSAGSTYTFQVTFTDDTAIDVSTVGANDVRVTGPNGFDQIASFVTIDNNTNGTPRTATYSITGPGGSFTTAANGTYTVVLLPNAVSDTSGNAVPAGALGTFQALIAGTYNVSNANDSGPGSLRAALALINAFPTPGDAIAFDPSFFNVARTIDLTSGELLIGDSVVIPGTGANLLTIRRDAGAATQFRIFNVNAPGTQNVTISGVTISGGNPTGTAGGGPGGDGGAILLFNDSLTLDGVVISGNTSGTEGGAIGIASRSNGGSGSLTIRNSTISGNASTGIPTGAYGGAGGAIYFANGGSLLIENSTVSGNTSTNQGGGVYLYQDSTAPMTAVIRNSTIANNTAGTTGGGIQANVSGGATNPDLLLLQNSTVVGNSAPAGGGGISRIGLGMGVLTIQSSVIAFNVNSGGTAPDVSDAVTASFSLIRDQTGAIITDGGNNLAAGTDPLLVGGSTPTLADNGGPTRTVALQAGSPLLNVGSNPANLTTDQRGPGFVRTSGTGTDIGAFEVQAATAPTVVANGVRVNGGQANTTQRSRVTSIDVEFSTVVTFAGAVSAAFQLTRIGGGAVGGFTATANTVGGHTVVTLNAFTGAESQFGSLADGRYQLTAVANQITAGGLQLDGDGNGTGGDNFVLNGTTGNGLFRFFGDVNGDGTDNAADFGPFRAAFGTSTGNPLYRDYLDFNADNTINAADFAQFRSRFGASVP